MNLNYESNIGSRYNISHLFFSDIDYDDFFVPQLEVDEKVSPIPPLKVDQKISPMSPLEGNKKVSPMRPLNGY